MYVEGLTANMFMDDPQKHKPAGEEKAWNDSEQQEPVNLFWKRTFR